MPIIKINDSVEVQFGDGDIGVMPGLLELDEVVGAICFNEQPKTPIGTRTDYNPVRRAEIEETPVRFSFSSIESIDVVIRSLESVKTFMKNGTISEFPET